jgi:hypothetical protein
VERNCLMLYPLKVGIDSRFSPVRLFLGVIATEKSSTLAIADGRARGR